jgi:hypothetical protein
MRRFTQILKISALKVHVYTANDIDGRNHVHARRNLQTRIDFNRRDTQVFKIFSIPIANCLATRLPATAIRTARQGS